MYAGGQETGPQAEATPQHNPFSSALILQH